MWGCGTMWGVIAGVAFSGLLAVLHERARRNHGRSLRR
jgi:hypothetical protein